MTGFARLLRAEWTKFRTVRGWVLGLSAAAAATVLLGVLSATGTHTSCGGPSDVCPAVPKGPGGEAVDDKFFFVHRELAGNGEITARVTALTGRIRVPDADPGVRRVVPGVVPWAKAGIMVKDGTRQGSAYAALMVTGKHGVRMQHDFTHDTAGSPGGASRDAPRWLRLVRSGDTLTGHESADGRRWTRVGTARLDGLPATVRVGLFVTSPGDLRVTRGDLGGTVAAVRFTEATGVFDRVGVRAATPGGAVSGAAGTWRHDDVGATLEPDGAAHHPGGATESGGGFTVTGTGDIAPRLDGRTVEDTLTGVPTGLIVVIVVAAGFVTAEYRRGLIRTTLAAGPRRGRALAAKAAVIAGAAFAAGLGAGAVVPIGTRILRSNGNHVLPVTMFTEVRVVVGAAALLAVGAVLALALGSLFRRGAMAVTAAIALTVLPHVVATASVLPADAADWVLRLTPAAGFAVLQSVPEYPQVIGHYTPQGGYYPLEPWAGFAVFCGYAALALGLAAVLLRRRDA
ncbi:hypothetical protein GCM10023085_58720 [Actinomadura viridis]|uniref:ABC-type transport system involved in multi-copper enzyme maturation permease subunit n=1 Tax=Actinomadura viridis TaxID=58110 RepID=A0A931GUM9_9ACTN|nr:ABC transporter permease subunit [Actinomadura viridis]MBG6093334.1 ABC-type transport system involved in multi-copper enzyme maturation permease subunit [Actinomadura viridis]